MKEVSVAAAAAESLQLCPTLCNPIDGSPLGHSVPGILQARILEWVAISFSNAWKWKGKVKLLSRARLLVTPWTAAYQAPTYPRGTQLNSFVILNSMVYAYTRAAFKEHIIYAVTIVHH